MKPKTYFNTLEEAIAGTEAPPAIIETLALVEVPYCDFDTENHTGQLVVHKNLAEEIKGIFQEIFEIRFPIHSITPIAAYDWNDEASMEDNNSSAFNYRRIIATNELSNHSFGRAIDINPLQNPYYARDGRIYPEAVQHDFSKPGTLSLDHSVVMLFKERGWRWLGEREHNKDFQHFQKPQ